MASLSLAEEITSPSKKSIDNTTTTKFLTETTAIADRRTNQVPVSSAATNQSKDLITLVNKTSEMINSNPMLKLLVEMGFPVTYIEHAMKELGEGARPEQLVSWLLQHPDLKVSAFASRNHLILSSTSFACLDVLGKRSFFATYI